MIIISIVSIIPTAFITLNALEDSSKTQAMEFGKKSAEYNSEIIRIWLGDKSNTLIGLNRKLRSNQSIFSRQRLLQIFSDSNPDFISIFYGLEDNTLVDAYGWIPNDSYNVISRPWYVKANNQDAFVTTSVYNDANKNRNVTALAMDIELDKKSGVLAANIDIQYLIELVQDITFGKSGIAILIDDSGEIITTSRTNSNLKKYTTQIEKHQDDINSNGVYYFDDDSEYIIAFSTIEGFDWRLILIAPITDFLDTAIEVRQDIIYLTASILIFIVLLDLYLGYTFSRPIEGLMDCITRIAHGDFNKQVEVRSKGEIGHLVMEIDKMRIKLKKIFTSMRYESDILTMNTQSLSEHIEGMHVGTNRFMSLLSHDIKTPVTLIKGYSKAISLNMVDEEKSKMYIERIHYRSEQIEHIVEDILDHTYEVQNISVRLTPVSCNEYADLILRNVKQYVLNQNHGFKLHIDQETLSNLGNVQVDLVKIQRVMNNILSNAIKYSSEESEIELFIFNKDTKLITIVQDSGQGIDPLELNKIFNMFYKAENSKKGYGLGLYIMKGIIEAHYGDVILESQLGIGTRCGFSLKISELT